MRTQPTGARDDERRRTTTPSLLGRARPSVPRRRGPCEREEEVCERAALLDGHEERSGLHSSARQSAGRNDHRRARRVASPLPPSR